ncbi:MAG: hypothetical protein AAGF74_07220 [Pseudomonadota bacterium]
MSLDGDIDEVIGRLRTFLDRDNLNADVAKSGTTLLERLMAPVTIAVMGQRHSGKSHLVNLLVGADVLAMGAEWPSVELIAGPVERTVFRLETGETSEVDGLPGLRLPKGTVLMRIEAPLPRLTNVRLLEVVSENDPDEMQAALSWAARQADIGIWCTEQFNATERSYWQSVPDALKDHSFLALNPRAAMRHFDLVAEAAQEEFYQTVVASEDLLDPVSRMVSQGRRGDTDSALVFLAKHGAPDASGGLRKTQARAGAKQKEVPTEALAPMEEAALSDALERLLRASRGLAEIVADPTDGGVDEDRARVVLNTCLSEAEDLADRLSIASDSQPGLAVYANDFQEAAEMMVLLQLEDSDGPAADAVTLLLQLKRDLEVALAA